MAQYAYKMSTPGRPSGRQIGAAEAYVNSQQARGRVAFSLADFMEETGLTSNAARKQLGRLGTRIVRVSPAQPFFLIVPLEDLAFGAPPVDRWLDRYFRWLGRPYYVALLSAAGAHGSNPQAIQVTQVMTDTSRRPIEIGRLRVIFYVKRRIEQTPVQMMPNAYAPTKASTPVSTLFDLVRYADRIGGIGRAAETIRPLLPLVQRREVRAVLDAEEEITTAQRLGYLFERSGRADLANVVDQWLPASRRRIPLEPGSKSPVQPLLSSRWQVLDNTGEFTP